MKKINSGYVAIVGKPNVGKSTFINTIMKRKISITSYKPQTTRKQIKALYNDEGSSIFFIDTPGFHIPRNKFDVEMNKEVKSSYKVADCILYLIDLTRDFDNEDEEVIKTIKDFKVENIIVVFTKNDLVKEQKITPFVSELKNKLSFSDFVSISSLKNNNINQLLELIKKYLPKSEVFFENNDDDDNFVISELIREQIIFNTKKEIPYSTFVEIEEKKFVDNLFTINAVIHVEKESQKPIMIGKGGLMLKKIGTHARKELLKVYDCKINLKLFVKTTQNWRNNLDSIK
ncbi:MAG: GTPase Era [Mycoplasmataceae bacterium]|jgi:GTP-binding protein Era|nr:GTPase Era [Mycoplasmataceae bacterium]